MSAGQDMSDLLLLLLFLLFSSLTKLHTCLLNPLSIRRGRKFANPAMHRDKKAEDDFVRW